MKGSYPAGPALRRGAERSWLIKTIGSLFILVKGVMIHMEVWLQLVTSVGFPIAACFALWYYMLQLLNEHKQELSEQRQEHREEVQALRVSLEANTEALIELKEYIKNGAN